MSLDINLKLNDATVYECNITHNLNEMAKQAGIYTAMWHPEQLEIAIAKNLVPILKKGLDLLEKYPMVFKELNPENGWGCYEDLLYIVEEYLLACGKYPDAVVWVGR